MNLFFSLSLLTCFISCKDEVTGEKDGESTVTEERLSELRSMCNMYNKNITTLSDLANERVEITDYLIEEKEGKIKLKLENEIDLEITTESKEAASCDIPQLSINKEGYWIYTINGETLTLKDNEGKEVIALTGRDKKNLNPQIQWKDNTWKVSFNGYQWDELANSTNIFPENYSPDNFTIFKKGEFKKEDNTIVLYLKNSDLVLKLDAGNSNSAEAWKMFDMNSSENVLPDYSYAGYNHGESIPLDGFAYGYKVYDVKKYMTEKNLSAREATIEILKENKMIRFEGNNKNNPEAKVVIYYPEGEYVMQKEGDGEFPSIVAGNFVIKGDGPDKTKIIMETPFTEKALLRISHTQSPTSLKANELYAKVTKNARKGSFHVDVNSTSLLTPGKYVQLRIRSGNQDFVKEEIGPLCGIGSNSWEIKERPDIEGDNDGYNKGIKYIEIHQIKEISGNRVYFYEPLSHDINIAYDDFGGWEIREYQYFENVGVEGIKFKGNAVTPYYHHGDGNSEISPDEYDYGYCPLAFSRVLNSWARDLEFESISEAITIGESAYSSIYDIKIYGNRGHSAVRAAGSTRIFIGKVSDESCDGIPNKFGTIGKGQWHGCGVSKPSVGNVIWNCNWGENACFESHATQPRSTLIDRCSGGIVQFHFGGATEQAPNHLADLTIWNLYVTGTTDEQGRDVGTDFKWWLENNQYCKIYPPIVVGTHGSPISFSKGEPGKEQVTYEESTGTMVTPVSLYEAQMKKRLGYVPAWLKAIK